MATDAELLALIGRAPQTKQASNTASLPDLDMTMLLSPSAQREVEAAQGMSHRPFQATEADMLEALGRPASNFAEEAAMSLYESYNAALDSQVVEELYEAPVQAVDVHNIPLESLWSTDPTDEIDDGPTTAALPPVEAGLENLFMTGEALEAAQAMGGGFSSGQPARTPMPDEFGISFDAELDMSGGPRPTGSMSPYRFQIGRESPPPAARPMTSRQASLGGQDGVVVSQQGPNGFRPTQRATQPITRAAIPRAETYTPPPPVPMESRQSRFACLDDD